jgi:hypothetical protein
MDFEATTENLVFYVIYIDFNVDYIENTRSSVVASKSIAVTTLLPCRCPTVVAFVHSTILTSSHYVTTCMYSERKNSEGKLRCI